MRERREGERKEEKERGKKNNVKGEMVVAEARATSLEHGMSMPLYLRICV